MCDSKAGQHLPLPIQVHFGLLLVLPLELCCLTIPYYSHFSLPLSFSVPFLFELSFHFLLPFCLFPQCHPMSIPGSMMQYCLMPLLPRLPPFKYISPELID